MSAVAPAVRGGLRIAAPAKLNLYLHVVGRRDDGYHLLDSLAAFAAIGDELTFAPAADLSLAIDGPFARDLAADENNLVLRAARALAGRAGLVPKASIRLTKRVPVAAGLGGGSADAAASLLALVELWRVALPVEELFDLAASLGADVPMCLAGGVAQVGGVGDRVGPAVALPPAGILLVNPGLPLATPPVFAAYARSGVPFSAAAPLERAVPDVATLGVELASRGNDLTAAAATLAPAIDDARRALAATPGCRVAQMSGSGATVFALYDDADGARRAASVIARDHPAWWCHAGRLA